ncbi:VOC family protein [Vibrio parahaemolyticus]|uniref:VOC family protein n=1 Tax=Vibrio parahaemolyticus TaxID=670 RepID=UPI00188376B9|nr:VOC family protein [Vibrio parahaemolyticus]
MFSHYILYVLNQEASSKFYEHVLGLTPVLDVPGMTEFHLSNNCKLGLIPYAGINKLLGMDCTSSSEACLNPSSELYLVVDNPHDYHKRSLNFGGVELSPVQERNWGHIVGYSKDIDGHIIAFAKPC